MPQKSCDEKMVQSFAQRRSVRTRAYPRCFPLLGLLFVGCAGSAGDGFDEDDADTRSQTLLQYAGTALWTENDDLIPMCWHQLDGFATPAEASAAQAFVAQTIQEGWINPLDLRTSWEDCPTAGGATHVRVKLRIGDARNHGTTLATGMATLSNAEQRLVPPPSDPPGLLMGFRANWNESAQTRAEFRSLILHEFGHVLGFGHEQLRPDGPSSVSCYEESLPDALLIGAPDPTSIMGWSYCNEALGALSPGDVRAARSVYGVGHSGSNDFNDDGRADILWHNAVTGASQIWFMSGSSRIGRATIGDGRRDIPIGPPWSIVGSNDFNSDAQTDVLWHNASTGETQAWMMHGQTRVRTATVLREDGKPMFVGLPWSITGTNDFNRDGATDLLWHNASSGETQAWLMNGVRIARRTTVVAENGRPMFVGLPWRIAGTNDFDQDGATDILWHNASTGETQVWLMNGLQIARRVTIAREDGGRILVGLPWYIEGTNDFNQDGAADILWHNESTGETQIWLMNAQRIARRVTVDAVLEGGGELIQSPWSIMNH